jgi:predicted nucleic acid-binding protein
MAERDTLIDIFRQDSQLAYDVWPVTTAIYISAGNLCRSHKLRAYDAVQLACALSVRDDALTSHVTAPLFVCADIGLISVAMDEGFSVENPSNYP